jgi:hypothetical protein
VTSGRSPAFRHPVPSRSIDSIVPAGGGAVDDAGVFSDLAFTWNGISYTAARRTPGTSSSMRTAN